MCSESPKPDDISNQLIANKIKLVKFKLDELKSVVSYSKAYTIRDRCDKIKNQIDVQTEYLIEQLNRQRQELFDEIDAYEKQEFTIHSSPEKLSQVREAVLEINVDSRMLDASAEETDKFLCGLIELENRFRTLHFGCSWLQLDQRTLLFGKNILGRVCVEDIDVKSKITPEQFDFDNPIKQRLFNVTTRSKLKRLENGRFVHGQSNSKVNFSLFILTNSLKHVKFERTVYRPLLVYENFLEVFRNKIFLYLELYNDDEDYRHKFENHFLVLDDNLNILNEKSTSIFNYQIRKTACNESFILCVSTSNHVYAFDWTLNEVAVNVGAVTQHVEYLNQIKLSDENLFASYKREKNETRNFFMRVLCLKSGAILSDFELDDNCHEFDLFGNLNLLAIFKYVGPSFVFYNWISGLVEYRYETDFNAVCRNPLILIRANCAGPILFYDYFKRILYKIVSDFY